MDKKGMMMQIVLGVATIALIFVVFYALGGFLGIGNSAAAREICRDSVLLQAQSKLIGGVPLVQSLRCDLDSDTIKTDDVEEIKKEITFLMYDCWYEFGEHGKNFISDWGSKDTWVKVCAKRNFKEGISDSVETIKDLPDFWAETKIPLNEEETFYDYFYGTNVVKKIPLEISTDESIYVVFVGFKSNKEADFYRDIYSIDNIFEELGVIGLDYVSGESRSVANALITSHVYNPDLTGSILVGNAESVIAELGGYVDVKCISGDVEPCLINYQIGDCREGRKICLDDGTFGDCEQTVFPKQKKENCLEDTGDEDCNGDYNCADDACVTGVKCGDNKICIGIDCLDNVPLPDRGTGIDL